MTLPKPIRANRIAGLILVIALAATVFAWWRERELARRGQVIRWQDNFSRLQPLLAPLLGQRFDALRDSAMATFLRSGAQPQSWNIFLTVSEWRQRFPGMTAVGYAEYSPEQALIKYSDSIGQPQALAPGSDLAANPVLHEAIQGCVDAGYGLPSRPVALGGGSNETQVVVGMIPIPRKPQRPGTASENRSNVVGVLFFALNQAEYFQYCQPQFNALPFTLRLLAPGEAAPQRSTTQRPFTVTTAAGEWRMLATMTVPPRQSQLPQWIVLFGGTALSILLYWLFSTQARLRQEAEASREKVLARDAEITALNRDLEEKITVRTAELHEALAEERELNKLKGNFISMVTHEIRTPLALILGSSEILSRYFDRLASGKRAEHLEAINASVHRMSALMEDVLLFSRAEAGRIDFKPGVLDLPVLCHTVVDEVTSATNRRCPIELSVGVMAEPARVDENLLRHILSNLLTNAIKYSPAGRKVFIEVIREEGNAVFTVTDSGMGIPAEDRSRLFTPFHRGKNAATIQGTGLGLAIVSHCVQRHGGRIEIESEEGAGTVVTVWLPLFSPAHTEFVHRRAREAAAKVT